MPNLNDSLIDLLTLYL